MLDIRYSAAVPYHAIIEILVLVLRPEKAVFAVLWLVIARKTRLVAKPDCYACSTCLQLDNPLSVPSLRDEHITLCALSCK
jgi:hypothetical protein